MRIVSRVASLWRNLSRKQRVDEELDAELRACLEILAEQKIESGLSPEEAWRSARLELGGVEQVKEQVREVKAGFFMESVWGDVVYGARCLLKSRGVTAAAVLSLALGIGLNSAIFAAINAVLLRPFPYKDPERVVHVDEDDRGGISPANYLDWQARSHVFESMAVYDKQNRTFLMSTGEESERVGGYHVSASFFSVLGVQPILGRTFLPEEDRPGADVVIIGHGLWRRRFSSDPDVVGRQITVNGRIRTIVGVMGEEFRFYNPAYAREDQELELWRPYAFEHNAPTNRRFYINSAIARLKPGVSIEQARAEMGIIAEQLALEYPEVNKGVGIWVGSSTEFYGDPSRSTLLLAWGTMALVLLIACANVANLFLVRTESRRQEVAVRMAIGAGRARVVRQLLTETLLIAIAGGFGAMILASFGTDAIRLFLPGADQIRRLGEASVDGRVLAFTLLVAVCTGLLCGLAPALRGSRISLADAVKDSGRSVSEGPGGARIRGSLVVLQVALSLVLLAGTGLMVHSLWKLHEVRLGFQPDRLLTFRVGLAVGPPYATDLGFQTLPDSSEQRGYWSITPAAMEWPKRVLERLRRIPGVEAAAAGDGAPMIQTYAGRPFRIVGRAEPSSDEAGEMRPYRWWVTPDYFRTMGIALLQGRDFNAGDTLASPRVAIVNRFIADAYWPDQATPLGENILLDDQPYEIVGVVDDVRAWPRTETGPQIYRPMAQNWAERYVHLFIGPRLSFAFLLRTHGNPASIADTVRFAFQDVEKDAPIRELRTMGEVIAGSSSSARSTMALLGASGLLALLLSAVGIYGVISYAATLRKHEIGIRVALGASRSAVEWLVMKRGMTLIVGGILVGSAAAYGMTRLIASHLFGVTPLDPLALAAAFLLLLLVALVACYLPARRAGQMDPVAALRSGQE